MIFLTTIQLYSASDEELLMQIVALIERTCVNKHLKQWLQIHSNGLILQKGIEEIGLLYEKLLELPFCLCSAA